MKHRKERKNGKQKRETEYGALRQKPRRVARAFFLSLLALLLAVATVGGALTAIGALYVEYHPDRFAVDLSLFSSEGKYGAAELYYFEGGAKDGTVDLERAALYATLSGGERSVYVPLSEIPRNLQNAFVAIEDKRFYTHRGVDLRRTGAAVLNYLCRRSVSFGGSTITQQLVKNVTGENAKTPMRKITEVFRALDLERNLGKEEILECYLNVISLANGCRGVGSAALFYFGKEPMELTLSECASIAAITQNPTRYDPIRHPESNKTRRDSILREMLLQGYIGEDEYRTAIGNPVRVVEKHGQDDTDARSAGETYNSWYTDLVVKDVIDGLCEEYGYTRAEASHLLYYGGLRIYTPIDPVLQETLSAYYSDASHFPRLENGRAPECAMIVLDPETGNILAVAGAIGEKRGDRVYSYATDAKRPPGSVLKPLSVYAPALEWGAIQYASVYDDTPVRFVRQADGRYVAWPKNASGVYRGKASIDYAVSHSLNTVAVRVLEEIGIDRSFDFLKNTLGITSLRDGENGVTDRGTAALALGQMNYGTTLREITTAYTALANGGIFRNSRSFLLVTDPSGRVLLENGSVVRRAISESNAELMTRLLENVTGSGTARSLTLTDSVSVAGKTGTTQYSFDRWFVGYTPSLLAGVWYGCDYPESLSELSRSPALSVWDGAMRALYETDSPAVDHTRTAFRYPHLRAVRVCADSGLLLRDGCLSDVRGSRSSVAFFTDGTVPHELCPYHGKETGAS
ncbi:MAG: transglycosylase domain-containing protein [Clostridia bacterium]|nr:transglycosylase domain-containing protein [Clostridia bacterium]